MIELLKSCELFSSSSSVFSKGLIHNRGSRGNSALDSVQFAEGQNKWEHCEKAIYHNSKFLSEWD